jgi:glycosyltransferase involved in cell wall biosynthesis
MNQKQTKPITYSIIVATYNRLDELVELIDSLNYMDFDPTRFELIVVDDGSTDGTAEMIEQLDTPYALHLHRQQNQGPGAARNRGMTEANGDYFLFIDSDCTVPASYLNTIDASVRTNQWDAFGGPDTCRPDFPPLLKAINYSMTSFLGTGGTRGSSKSVTKFYPRSYNMGIHRKVHEQIGGMNDLRHGQDMDLSARIYEAGFSVGLIEDAYVFHKRRTDLKKFFRQIFNWGVARINLGKAHPELLKPIHLAPAVLIAASLLTVVLALFLPQTTILVYGLMLAALAIALTATIQSYLRYREIRPALLSPVTLFLQVIAYGLGTLSGLLQTTAGKPEAKGFTKKYYQ